MASAIFLTEALGERKHISFKMIYKPEDHSLKIHHSNASHVEFIS